MSSKKGLKRIRFFCYVFIWLYLLLIGISIFIILPSLGVFNNPIEISGIAAGGTSEWADWGLFFSQIISTFLKIIAYMLSIQVLARVVQFVLALLEKLEKRSGAPADMDIASLPELNG